MSSRLFARTSAAAFGFALVGSVLSLVWSTHAADEKDKEKPKELAKRKPWTTSKVTGSPEPPPKFKSVRVFPKVKFDHPLLIARCPGSERLFVGEQAGVLYSLANTPDAKPEVFLDLRKELAKSIARTTDAKGLGELYGLVFHPEFEKNRFCYVCYTVTSKNPKVPNLPDGTRVSRFVVPKADPPRIDPASEEVVITFQGGGHNGGDLHFGPDGFLYITTGDGAGPNPPDTLNTGQDCSDLLSSVLRIDVNRQDPGKNHAVPKDNPFVGMKDVRPEIWAFGFRNPWRMSFDRETGDLWLGDVGWELWEMVHKIEKGGNYGWSIVEGRQPVKPEQKIGPTPIRPPAIELPHTIAASVTGGYVYRGKKFPELKGAYIFGDWETRRIWAARFDGDRLKEMPEIVKPNVRPSAFGEDNAGEIYYCDYDTGLMYTLERNDAAGVNTKFPTKLSDTGLFADVKKHEPAEGVVRFKPNSRQWQDGATAEYFIALPNLSAVTLFESPRPLPGQVFWHNFRTQFPPDAVLVKTLTVELASGGKKRVETQILHCDGEDWRGYTFAWRDNESDADLVPADGAEKVFEVPAPALPAKKREQVWTFHSRTQCLTCHNAWAEYALAFSPGQLNGSGHGTASAGPNQLVQFSRAGYIRRVDKADKPRPPFDESSAAKQPVVADVFDFTKKEEQRVRGYLHANCSHCHRFGGGGGQVVLEMDVSTPLKNTGLFDTKPRQGDFGLPEGRLIAPGVPERSVLYYRMAKFGRGRMPHRGSEYPDWEALKIVHRWISAMEKPAGAPDAPLIRNGGIDGGLSAPGNALLFALGLGGGAMPDDYGRKVIAAAGKLPPGPVRDLFEGYLPPDPKGRKLGSNPRPAAILALKGDAGKGETLFFSESLKCAKCHNVGDRGVALGADLTAIGKSRTRAELLDSLLNPSARIDPQFAAYNVKTKDDKSYTGLLVKRNASEVILRDAENKTVKLAADDVESVRPSRLSLMPDGQMSGLTPQEAADLLEFLASRK